MGSVASSAMSVVPQLDPEILFDMAVEIHDLKNKIVEKARQ